MGRNKMSESDQQIAFFQWLELNLLKHPAYLLIYAVPNGGQRHIAVATKLKKEGVKAGVWDIAVDWPSGGYHGLRIEMKHGKNKLTEQQEVWGVRYREAGYDTVVCYDWMSAVEALKSYLEKDDGKNKTRKTDGRKRFNLPS